MLRPSLWILASILTSFPSNSRAEPPLLRISLEDEPSSLLWKKGRTPVDRFLAPLLGAYEVATWERGKRIVLESATGVPGPRPAFRIELIFGPHEALLERFRKGQIDVFVGPSAEDIMSVSDARIEVHPGQGGRYLVWSASRSQDKALLETFEQGLPLSKLPAATRLGDQPVVLEQEMQRTERARSIRETALGGRAHIALTFLIPARSAERRIAQWVSDQVSPLRVSLRVIEKSGADYWEALKKGGHDLTLATWPSSTDNDSDLAAWVGKNRARLRISKPMHAFLLGPRVRRFQVEASGALRLQTLELVP